MERLRHLRGGRLIGTGTIDNDIAVAGEFVMTFGHFIHSQMNGTNDDGRIQFQFGAGPHIQDDQVFTGIQFPAQFLHGNPCHAQFVQQALPPPVFVGDV